MDYNVYGIVHILLQHIPVVYYVMCCGLAAPG